MKNAILFSLLGLFSLLAPGQAQETGPKTADIQIIDVKLGTNVQDRAITGEDSAFGADSKVFVWIKIANAASETISVIWKHQEQSYETKLTIGGSPWRTWASKTVWKSGEWTVTITDAAGNVLKELNFQVR